MDKFLDFITNNKNRLITSSITLVVIVIFIFVFSFSFGRFIKRQKSKRVITIAKLVNSIVRYTCAIVLFLAVLGIWGVDILPILQGIGVIGIIIGLGAQSLIKDLIAGISIVFDNYYDIDEVVEINGFKGRVLEVGLKSTRLVNWKGEIRVVSNGEITSVTNFSRNPSVGVVEIEIAYQEKINEVIHLIEENIISIKDLYPQIIEGPSILGVMGIGNNVKITITVKTISEQHYTVVRGINKFLKELFEANNIQMPYQKHIIYDEESINKL